MRYDFDYSIIEAINNAIRTVKAAPLMLGATSSGIGGPPGGFVGYLPQDRVSFDADEVSEWDIPASGISLLTNLNRIRYRLDAIESGGGGTFLGLADTPADYTGYAGYSVVVNGTEDGLEFVQISGGGATISGLTGDRVVITTESGVITTDEGLRYNRTLNALSIGDTTPLAETNNGLYQVSEGTSATHTLFTWGNGLASFILGYFTGGTQASPLAATINSIMLRLRGRAYDGATYNTTTSAEVRLVTDQEHAAGAHGTRIEVHTTPNDSTTLTKVATFTSSGHLNLETGTYDIGGVPHTHDDGATGSLFLLMGA